MFSEAVILTFFFWFLLQVAADVTFVVGERKEEIRAHKYMLMARSPVLFKSLSKHIGNNDIRIGVTDMRPDNFRDLLQYVQLY